METHRRRILSCVLVLILVPLVEACGLLGDDEPTTAPTPTTAVSPTPTPVDDVASGNGCTLNASFVADLTVPDQTVLAPGAAFTKSWRIENTGTCDWVVGFQLAFAGGEQMGAPPAIDVPPTPAGNTVDLSIDMVAPTTPGTHQGDWRMQTDLAQPFGSLFWVIIQVPAPPTATVVPTATPIPPAAPSNLFRSTSTTGWVSLIWTDNSSDEEGFHILADDDIFASTGADSPGYGFMYGDHFCDQTVQLTIVAYKGTSWSARSNAIEHTGPPCPPPIVAQGTGLTFPLSSYLDLDTGTIGAFSNNVDLLWQLSGGFRILGMNGMTFANVGLGGDVPSYVGCLYANRVETSIYTPTLQNGTRLCWNTTGGDLAGLYVEEIQADDSLLISFVTWDITP